MDETCTTPLDGRPCGEKAMCRYGWHAGDNQAACAAHDPLRPEMAACRTPWWYETIYRPPIQGAAIIPGQLAGPLT
jgi:hypothetical protein